jgi:ABC-type multidrug transport system permease subunit
MTKRIIDQDKEKMLDFKKIGAIIEKNFIVMTRDKTRLLSLLLFPIFMILVLGFTTGNTPKHISAAIVIYDDSPLSQQAQQQIYDSQTFAIKYRVSTEDEAKYLLDQGKVNVIIEIPPKFQDDINNGIQTSIIVIVDDSDSSIAAASNQALNMIISSISSQITTQKLIAYQHSVDLSANSIKNYADSQVNQYGIISDSLAKAQANIVSAKGAIDTYSDKISLSIPSAQPLVLPADSKTVYNNKLYNLTNENVIYSQNPAGESIRAQLSIMRVSSAMMSSANMQINNAQAVAKVAGGQEELLQDEYDALVSKPMITISMFTQEDAQSLLQPVIFETKPAYKSNLKPIDFLIPSLIALTLFQGAVMGMGRAVAGEKREGSLTRVFLTPTSNITIVVGTLLFYVLFELVRAIFLIAFSIVVFNIQIQGSYLLIGLILIIYISISTAIGMIVSSAVKTEQQFQAIAMLISLPTIFLSGVFFPLQAMPKVMQSIANIIPITYAADALRGVMVKALPLSMIMSPLIILMIFFVVCIGGVLAVFKRDIE